MSQKIVYTPTPKSPGVKSLAGETRKEDMFRTSDNSIFWPLNPERKESRAVKSRGAPQSVLKAIGKKSRRTKCEKRRVTVFTIVAWSYHSIDLDRSWKTIWQLAPRPLEVQSRPAVTLNPKFLPRPTFLVEEGKIEELFSGSLKITCCFKLDFLLPHSRLLSLRVSSLIPGSAEKKVWLFWKLTRRPFSQFGPRNFWMEDWGQEIAGFNGWDV